MSIRVTVETEQVNIKNGTNSRGPWQIREQEAWAHLVNRDETAQKYPSRIVLNLEDNQAPYPVGEYLISPASFWIGQYGNLMFRSRLKPVKKTVPA